MSGRITERLVFERKVGQLLLNKPQRYKDIIQSHIDRHLSYSDRVCCDIDVVIAYMVQLDKEYVREAEDAEFKTFKTRAEVEHMLENVKELLPDVEIKIYE